MWSNRHVRFSSHNIAWRCYSAGCARFELIICSAARLLGYLVARSNLSQVVIHKTRSSLMVTSMMFDITNDIMNRPNEWRLYTYSFGFIYHTLESRQSHDPATTTKHHHASNLRACCVYMPCISFQPHLHCDWVSCFILHRVIYHDAYHSLDGHDLAPRVQLQNCRLIEILRIQV